MERSDCAKAILGVLQTVGRYDTGMADLSGVKAKFRRARDHAVDFNKEFQRIVDARPFELRAQIEADGWCHIRWQQNGENPSLESLSLIFSDMLYNLRATLDYSVWQLVLANGGRPGRHTGFPCVVESAKWGSAAAVALRGVEQRWVDEIEKLQPCSPSYSGEPNGHPLALLDKANNLCKHRLLPAALMNAAYADHQISAMVPGGKMDFFFNDVPPADGEDHLRFTFEQPTKVTVVVDPNPVWRVNFPDLAGDPDWENMDLVNWVEGAIAVFEAAFE